MRTLTCGLLACSLLMGCEALEGDSPEAVTVPRADNTGSTTTSTTDPSSADGNASADNNTPSDGTPPRDGTPPGDDPSRPGVAPSPDAPCFQQSWYKNGQLRFEGECVCIFTNGECTSGVPDGLRTHYFKSGATQYELSYDDGVQHGTQTYWFESGQRQMEINIDQGLFHGLYRTWDADGTLTGCTCYVDQVHNWSDLEQCDTRPCPDPSVEE
jgi:hypothetical protein